MEIEHLMEVIVSDLPELSRTGGRKTVREVCLTFDGEGWRALAGGHPAVHIGEWGGDFEGDGSTAEEALSACRKNIKAATRS